MDVNITNSSLQLNLAYLCGHTQMTQYLTQHGVDMHAVITGGCMP